MGYADAVDPKFGMGGAALPVMIFPARKRIVYLSANTGPEYVPFWDELWCQAKTSLESSRRVVICGYSLQPIDKRARDLLLNTPKKDAEIVVASGDDTERVVSDYRGAGFTRAAAADEVLFQKWIANSAMSVAEAR